MKLEPKGGLKGSPVTQRGRFLGKANWQETIRSQIDAIGSDSAKQVQKRKIAIAWLSSRWLSLRLTANDGDLLETLGFSRVRFKESA